MIVAVAAAKVQVERTDELAKGRRIAQYKRAFDY
jgi:hypothetical protein